MSRSPIALTVAALTGWIASCGTNVLLGGSVDAGSARPDTSAMLDASQASLTPFPDGAYQMTISPTSNVVCMGAWVGMESAFSGITLATLGLVEGPVELLGTDATHVDFSGATIETDFMTTPVSLEKGGGPGVAPEIWIGIGTRVASGPLGSALIGVDLEADETTITSTGFDGRISAWYIDLAMDGTQCLVGFTTHFERL